MVLSESHRLSGWRARKIPVLTLKQEHPLGSFAGFGTLQGADQENPVISDSSEGDGETNAPIKAVRRG